MGPLASPARVTRQLIGIARPDYVPVYAAALEQLGTQAALIVCGEEGLDEVSCAGATLSQAIGAVDLPSRLAPGDAGLPCHPISAIRGGDAVHNAAALRALLRGQGGPYRDAVLLNAAVALKVAGRPADLPTCAREAAAAIDEGHADALLDAWIAYA